MKVKKRMMHTFFLNKKVDVFIKVLIINIVASAVSISFRKISQYFGV